MFIAKFNQVDMDSEKFVADTNDNMPYIGEVLSGKATGTLINGTIFERNELKPNVLYACENITEDYTNEEGVTTPQVRVQVISEITIMEFMQIRKELGKAILDIKKVDTANTVANNVPEEQFEA